MSDPVYDYIVIDATDEDTDTLTGRLDHHGKYGYHVTSVLPDGRIIMECKTEDQ